LDAALQVEVLTPRGGVTDVLLEVGRTAHQVLLAHRQRSRLHRVFNGSVAARVAAQCAVPVVSVPEFWTPWRDGTPYLTVGVHGDLIDDTVLDRALATPTGAVVNAQGAKTGIDYFSKDAWINDGNPTLGFLKFGASGPFKGFYNSIAGEAWVNVLFMFGLLAIGIACPAVPDPALTERST
jgi:hypothetical protein